MASTCPFCRSSATSRRYSTRAADGDVFEMYRCGECGCRFLSPAPSDEQLERAYSEQYYGSGERKFIGIIEGMIDKFRLRRVLQFERFVPPPADLLEVGCGRGDLCRVLLSRGYRCSAIEIPGRAAEAAARIPGLTLHVNGIEALEATKQFDAIVYWHVLEHLRTPAESLERAISLLRPEGHLFIALPNIESLQASIFRGSWFPLDPPRHLSFVGAAPLARRLEPLGMTLRQSSTFSLEHNFIGIIQSLLNCFQSRRDVFFDLLKSGRPERWTKYVVPFAGAALAAPPAAALFLAETILDCGGNLELVFQKKSDR